MKHVRLWWPLDKNFILAPLLQHLPSTTLTHLHCQENPIYCPWWWICLGFSFPRHFYRYWLVNTFNWTLSNFSLMQKQINLHDSLMDNGIVFIWLSHHQTGAIIDYFNSKGFQYVENFIFVLLDRQKISLHKKVNSQNSLLNFIKKTPKEN